MVCVVCVLLWAPSELCGDEYAGRGDDAVADDDLLHAVPQDVLHPLERRLKPPLLLLRFLLLLLALQQLQILPGGVLHQRVTGESGRVGVWDECNTRWAERRECKDCRSRTVEVSAVAIRPSASFLCTLLADPPCTNTNRQRSAAQQLQQTSQSVDSELEQCAGCRSPQCVGCGGSFVDGVRHEERLEVSALQPLEER